MAGETDTAAERAIKNALVILLPRLRRFCLALTASPADADDLCQATCERAIARLEQWTPGTRLDSWLYRIAQNLHKNETRDGRNRLRLLEERMADDGTLEDEKGSSSDRIEALDLKRQLLALPQPHREVLVLICIEGYSYDECADILGIPKTTVTNRLFQARSSLRSKIDPDLRGDDVAARSASA
ncbi:MAG: RNA polymerase sigma factor [Pseudomonadota bacterium]